MHLNIMQLSWSCQGSFAWGSKTNATKWQQCNCTFIWPNGLPCDSTFTAECALKGERAPLRLKRGWQILPNGSAVMTLASARHCTVSKTLPELLGHLLGLVRPLGSVNLLISHPLGSKDHNEPNLVLTELTWLLAIWVISTFQVINKSLWVIWGFLPPTVTERH